MLDTLKYVLTTIAVVCSSVLFVMSFVLWLHERHIYPLYELTKLARRPKFELFLLLFIVGGQIPYGATKGTNGNDRAVLVQSMRVAPRVVQVAVDSDGFCMTTNIEKYQMGNGPRMMLTLANAPTDYVSSGASWVTVTGDLSAGVVKSQSGTGTIPKGTKAFIGISLQSDEYPHYTSSASQYNDVLSWNVTATGHATIAGIRI